MLLEVASQCLSLGKKTHEHVLQSVLSGMGLGFGQREHSTCLCVCVFVSVRHSNGYCVIFCTLQQLGLNPEYLLPLNFRAAF